MAKRPYGRLASDVWRYAVGFLKGVGGLVGRHKSLSVTVALLVLAFAVVGEARRALVVIHPFEVPKQIEERGLTGAAMARRLADHMDAVRSATDTQMRLRELCEAESADPGELEVAGASFDVGRLVGILRRLTGRTPIEVTGDLIVEPVSAGAPPEGEVPRQQLVLNVRVNGRPAYRRSEIVPDAVLATTLDRVLAEAALASYDRAEPYVGAVYRLRKEDVDGARQRALAVLRQPPAHDDPWAANLLGLLASTDNPRQAIRWFEQAHELAEDDLFPPALLGLGVLHLERGDYAEAERHLREAAEHEVTAAKAEHALARTLARSGRHDEALRYFATAGRRREALPEVFIDWGSLLLEKGRCDEAREQLGRAVELAPHSLEARALLARALGSCGEPGEAAMTLSWLERMRDLSMLSAVDDGAAGEEAAPNPMSDDRESLIVAMAVPSGAADRPDLSVAGIQPFALDAWEPVMHPGLEAQLTDSSVAVDDLVEEIEVGRNPGSG